MDEFTHECRWCHREFPVGLLNGLMECADCEREQQNPEPDEGDILDEPITERPPLSLMGAIVSRRCGHANKERGVS